MTNSNVALKADKVYINQKVQQQVNGVKGTYNKLADLQVAFPTGATDNYIFVKNSDEAVNGYIYTWSGTMWVTTGILYQATRIANGTVTPAHLSFNAVAGNRRKTLI